MSAAAEAAFLPASYPLVQREDPAAYEGFVWRLDTPGAKGQSLLPQKFRTFEKSSGSAQCSPAQLKVLAAELKHRNGGGPVYDVDLRQEPHGYFDGRAVSWYGTRDWSSLGKSQREALQEEKKLLRGSKGRTRYLARLNKEKMPDGGEVLRVRSVLSEEDLAKQTGLHYFRIAATDHVWPSAENIDRFLAFYKTLPADAWVHFHCEAGVGRTTAFMAMYDMLRHPDVPLETILKRQHDIGGFYYGPWDTSSDTTWKGPYYQEKYEMMALFYDYVQANKGTDYRLSWSQWLRRLA